MNRVMVTGVGIVSSIGNRADEVVAAFREGRSGMVARPDWKALGYRCCIFAPVRTPQLPTLPRQIRRRLSTAATYALAAADQAVMDAKLEPEHLESPRAGIVFGSGLGGRCDWPNPPGYEADLDAPSRAWQLLGSSVPALLANVFRTQGLTLSSTTACATGLYDIGHAFELVRHGVLDLCLTGSADGELWDMVGLSGDNANGMPVDWNDRPTQACRPYDRDRQGFVMTAGSGALIMESERHARRRDAPIHAEVIGYGAANDGKDMFNASGKGMELCMSSALATASERGVSEVDYINSHGTGTLMGDAVESQALARLFGDRPLVSSTKGQTGHGQGATGAQEAVYTVLMMRHGFVAPTMNLDNIAPDCTGIRHVQQFIDMPLRTAMTINNGLGGVNAALVLRAAEAD